MTHNDIYTKFMIEYDKANVTSSYPSLTEYEVATVLDKAYNSIIAQKVTGNNMRRSSLESDIKSVSDLQPLIVTESPAITMDGGNKLKVDLNTLTDKMLYFVSAQLSVRPKANTMDSGYENRKLPFVLIDHKTADKFLQTPYNIPWIKRPVCYLENNYLYFLYDAVDYRFVDTIDNGYYYLSNVKIEQVKNPIVYVLVYHVSQSESTQLQTIIHIKAVMDGNTVYYFDDSDNTVKTKTFISLTYKDELLGISNKILAAGIGKNDVIITETTSDVPLGTIDVSDLNDIGKQLDFTYIKKPKPFVAETLTSGSYFSNGSGEYGNTEFECNDTVAEELISLAIMFALENVESPRLNNKINMRGLEV